MASDTKKGSYQQIRDQYYYIEISLYSQIEGQETLYVPFFYVESLKIHECLYEYITKAEIVFISDFELFARGAQKTPGSPNNNNKVPFIDRTDGRSRVHITLYPVDGKIDESGSFTVSENNDKYPKKYWEINYDFVVSHIYDLPVGNTQNKKKMYVLVSEQYQILKEKNIEWSSAVLSEKISGGSASRMKDSQAAINPNVGLKEFLKLVSTNGDTMPKIKLGFDEKGTIDKPNLDFDKIDETNWDAGKPGNKTLLFTTANTMALDDINDILGHCWSSDDFPVLLKYGRSSENKGWQLISLSKYFEKSVDEQVERIILEDALISDVDDGAEQPPYIPRSDASDGSPTKNFTSGIASRIRSYKFSPMSATYDNILMNTSLCYYDEHTGTFNVKKEQNNVLKLIEKLKELANKGLYNFKNTKNGQILLNLNKTKTEGQMTKNVYSLYGPYCLPTSPLKSLIFDSIFLNQSLSFQVLGLTLRTPGKFIFVDKAASGDNNPFDDRFLGQWWITHVSHLFTHDTYVTEVVANKIDSFSKIWPEQDNNY